MFVPIEPAEEVIEEFERALAITRIRAESHIGALVAELKNTSTISDEFYYEQIDALKGGLGSRAANACSNDADEQENAISRIEQWVADTISAADYATWIAAVLTLHGAEEGERIVRDQLTQNCAPPGPGP